MSTSVLVVLIIKWTKEKSSTHFHYQTRSRVQNFNRRRIRIIKIECLIAICEGVLALYFFRARSLAVLINQFKSIRNFPEKLSFIGVGPCVSMKSHSS